MQLHDSILTQHKLEAKRRQFAPTVSSMHYYSTQQNSQDFEDQKYRSEQQFNSDTFGDFEVDDIARCSLVLITNEIESFNSGI